MRHRRDLVLAALLLPLFLPPPAEAVLQAHFRVESYDGGCLVNDEDPFPLGDPDRYFRMAVFDAASASVLNGCPNGCGDDGTPATLEGETLDYCSQSTGCAFVDVADQEIVKTIPNGSGAFFYFGLFDSDDIDSDDSLGDHWQFASGFVNRISLLNSNNSPYYPGNPIQTACGDPVEGLGSTSNFRVTYRIWFMDTDGALAPTSVFHRDNGVPSSTNDDSVLEFEWSAGSDPHSGISGYRFWLWDATLGSYVFNNVVAPLDRTLFLCPSGCDFAYTPQVNHEYWFRVQSVNGGFPTLTTSTGAAATGGAQSAWVTVFNSVVGVDDAPARLYLARPVPNPSAGEATVSYELPAAGPVRLEVLDVQGRRIRILADGTGTPGRHRIDWDGRDDAGQAVDSGLFWLRLTAGGERRTERLVIAR